MNKIFAFVWRKRLDGLTVVKVRGWRTALVEGNLTSRRTVTFLFKLFGKWV